MSLGRMGRALVLGFGLNTFCFSSIKCLLVVLRVWKASSFWDMPIFIFGLVLIAAALFSYFLSPEEAEVRPIEIYLAEMKIEHCYVTTQILIAPPLPEPIETPPESQKKELDIYG